MAEFVARGPLGVTSLVVSGEVDIAESRACLDATPTVLEVIRPVDAFAARTGD